MNIQTGKIGPNSATSPETGGSGLAVNLDRKRFTIQNQSDADPLFIKLGAGASGSDYHVILAACTSAEDGTGGIFTLDGYQGEVSVYASSSADYSVIEFQ